MAWLRAILVISLLIGGLLTFFHIPYQSTVNLNGIEYTVDLLEERPWFEPPPKNKLKDFKGKVSEYINEESVTITTVVNREKVFKRLAMLVIGLLFLYGVIGCFVDKHRPRGMDVIYSTTLTLGLMIATGLSALCAHWMDRPFGFLWFSYFWTGGLLLAFILTFARRRALGEAM